MVKLNATQATDSPQVLKTLYLVMAIAGAIAPWYWLIHEPAALLSPSVFFELASANNIARALGSDLSISAIAFLTLVWMELGRLKQSRWLILLFVGLTFGIGLSCSLPFFLYRREAILQHNASR